MPFQNTYTSFLYRQLFLTPPAITKATCTLTGKTGIVTGSNTGLGYHASSQLLSLGLSHLILAVRDPAKGEAAKTSLLSTLKKQADNSSNSTPTIEVWPLDMTSYTSITALASRIRSTPDLTVDFCLLNAGVALFSYQKAAPNGGNELTIQTNWLGTALLAILLRPILQAQYTRVTAAASGSDSGSGRLVTKDGAAPTTPPVLSIVGSEVAQWASFAERKFAAKTHTSMLSVLNDPARFSAGDRYYTSKLLLTLFFREFVGRLPADNAVVVNIVNPGFCYGSELHRELGGRLLGKIFGAMKRAIGRSTEVGARTLVHGAVVAGSGSHGRYLSDEKVAPFMDFPMSEEGEACGRELWGEMEGELGGCVDVGAVMREG